MKEKCSATIEKRIVTFNESFRQRMHSKVSKQLYPEHRLLFSFLLASKTMQHSQLIDPEEWEFFVGNQFTEVDRDLAVSSRPATSPLGATICVSEICRIVVI